MKPKVYIFPFSEKHSLGSDTTKTQHITFLLGSYITNAFQDTEEMSKELTHVRLKVGSSTIVAQKRINDVKVIIYEDVNQITNN